MNSLRLFLSALLFVMFTLSGYAQTVKETLTNKDIPLIFYGIDFTKAKLIGDANANTKDIVERQFTGINDLMIKEYKKYDIAGALRRDRIPANLNIVAKRNESINDATLLTSNTSDYNLLTEKDIQKLISGFSADDKSKTGILFVVDGMNKPEKRISAWVTFFNPATKKVLLTERIEGSVGMAFSFRNYWAAGIKSIIESIGSTKYKEWTTK